MFKTAKRLCASFLLILGLGVSGCGSYHQAVQVDDNAYVLLIGGGSGFVGKSLTLNDQQIFNLGSSQDVQVFDLNGENAIKIRVPAGKHNIKIYDHDSLIVNRNFYVSTGTSFEVKL